MDVVEDGWTNPIDMLLTIESPIEETMNTPQETKIVRDKMRTMDFLDTNISHKETVEPLSKLFLSDLFQWQLMPQIFNSMVKSL